VAQPQEPQPGSLFTSTFTNSRLFNTPPLTPEQARQNLADCFAHQAAEFKKLSLANGQRTIDLIGKKRKRDLTPRPDISPMSSRAKQIRFQDERLDRAYEQIENQRKQIQALKKLTATSLDTRSTEIKTLKDHHKDEMYKMIERMHALEYKMNQIS